MGKRPIVAVTMGDPAGVGPEVTAKALAQRDVWDCCRPMVVGDTGTLKRAAELVQAALVPRRITKPAEVSFDPNAPDVFDLYRIDVTKVRPGEVSVVAGRAALAYVEQATELALSSQVGALVTGPINKRRAARTSGTPRCLRS
jgi:4-hydroxythreonine-4-phosphate dehydrogenase